MTEKQCLLKNYDVASGAPQFTTVFQLLPRSGVAGGLFTLNLSLYVYLYKYPGRSAESTGSPQVASSELPDVTLNSGPLEAAGAHRPSHLSSFFYFS